MVQYISKAALIAEIERWIELLTNQKNQEGASQIDKLSLGGRIAELQEVKSFLDTLEVKEVDFEKKELKKLGQSEVTKTSDQEEIAEIPFGAKDSELQEATYFIPKGFHAEIDDDKVVIKKGERKPAWSKEDETRLTNIIIVIAVTFTTNFAITFAQMLWGMTQTKNTNVTKRFKL